MIWGNSPVKQIYKGIRLFSAKTAHKYNKNSLTSKSLRVWLGKFIGAWRTSTHFNNSSKLAAASLHAVLSTSAVRLQIRESTEARHDECLGFVYIFQRTSRNHIQGTKKPESYLQYFSSSMYLFKDIMNLPFWSFSTNTWEAFAETSSNLCSDFPAGPFCGAISAHVLPKGVGEIQ